MPHDAALDVSQETPCVCLVDETGRVISEAKLPTCPDAITAWLGQKAVDRARRLGDRPDGGLALERTARPRSTRDLP